MKIKINDNELTIRNAQFDKNDVLDFVTDDPPSQILEAIFHAYDDETEVVLDIGGIKTNVMITMFLPFDNHKGMSYNIRTKQNDNAGKSAPTI